MSSQKIANVEQSIMKFRAKFSENRTGTKNFQATNQKPHKHKNFKFEIFAKYLP